MFIDNNVKRYSLQVKRLLCNEDNRSKKREKEIGNYVIQKVIGQGSFGKVKLAINKFTKEKVAIKVLQKAMLNTKIDIHKEIKIIKQLKHPNIANFYELIENNDHVFIVMEYCDKGTLLSYIMNNPILPEEECRRIFSQILSAIKYCHENQIIHRDLKHENILLDSSNNCKLIDFGMGNFVNGENLRSTFCGTPAFVSPELIIGKKYDGCKVDIWSMGVVLFMLVTKSLPFSNIEDTIKGIYKIPDTVSQECADLLKKMLQIDPLKRISTDEICTHNWITNVNK